MITEQLTALQPTAAELMPTLAPAETAPPPPRSELSFKQFEEAGKQLPDSVVLDVMNDQLQSVPGEQPRFLKSYLDQVRTDESDNAYIDSPDQVIGFRNELTDFVSSHLTVKTSNKLLSPQQKDVITGKVEDFKDKLEADKVEVAEYITGTYEGKQQPIPRGALGYNGLTVITKNGTVDLLKDKVPGVRANITMQREASGSFVHYASEPYLDKRSSGVKPELGKRIYLNPKIESSIGIFTDIVEAAEAAGITMKGKVFDRTLEAVARRADNPDKRTARGDGIVLYAGEDADALLGLVEAIYKDSPGAFEGRKTSRIPLRIAEGIAVGDEPIKTSSDEEAESLTSSRAGAIQVASGEAKRMLGLQASEEIRPGQEAQAVAAFRTAFKQVATQAGIDPDNLAFNLPKAA